MDDQTFQLLINRLDLIQKQNDDQLALLHKHLEDDAAVKTQVTKHSTYFKVMGLGLPPVLAYLATKLGIK